MPFPATRAEALHRLRDFLPNAGRDYAARRNFDLPGHPHVSGLSPYLRHRLILEPEVLAATLARHSAQAADKFISEVFWRTYWKGWLEQRPGLWPAYRADLAAALNRVQSEAGLRAAWADACSGKTGIDCFDHWAQELATTGYLHNHARMWFASIWIFTLRLPWELGADFFLRHLLDGDAASNTLSWRWVAGLHTPGKTYLARADNIARYTEGRFRPTGLATSAAALTGPPHPAPRALPPPEDWAPDLRTGLILTEDDLSPGWLLQQGLRPAATLLLPGLAGRSPLAVAPQVGAFTLDAMADTVARYGSQLGPVTGPPEITSAAACLDWARAAELTQVVVPYAPVGPAADLLAEVARLLTAAGIPLFRPMRAFDRAAWPHARSGFFKFREAIPTLLAEFAGG